MLGGDWTDTVVVTTERLSLRKMTTEAECCFVLSGRVCAFSKSDIAAAISKVVMLDGVVVDDARQINDALELYSKHGVDYWDAYLAAAARAGNLLVATFDGDFQRLGASVYPL
jgi:predicted nucleic acid-binding protein